MAGDSIFVDLWQSRLAILHGLDLTITISTASVLLGLLIGGVFATTAVFGPGILRALVTTYVFVLRGTPLLVTILFIYFGLAVAWRALPATWAATLSLGLFAGAYMTEIFRGAIQSIPRAQLDAAKAIGLPFLSRIFLVVVPLAIRRALPSATNIVVEIVKASTLVSALGIGDLFLTGQQLAMRTLRIPEVYLFLWLAYFAIDAALTHLSRRFEERYRHVVF
jgi:polar amino acid transport system permease protein